MFRNILTNLIITALTLILIGCSGGGNTPVNPGPIDGQTDSEPVVYISEDILEGSSLPMIFGIYEVSLDATTMTGDIRPVRNLSALGDSVMVDVTPFLSITPCSNCMKIKSIGLSPENYLEVTFQTKHPFEPGKRLDLHVFDPRGIIVTGYNPTQFSRLRIDLDGDGSYESPAEGNIDLVVNADGYTSFYDAVVEDFTGYNVAGNISPFKNLWFNPATSEPDSNYNPIQAPDYGFRDLNAPTGHNVFPMGGTFDNPLASTTYTFNLAGTTNVNFLFVFEAAYGVTSTRFTRQQPRYFLPEFHRKEALSVRNIVDGNLVAYDSSDTITTSLGISVIDWQAGISVTENWDYGTSVLTALKYKSDVKSIVVDVPGVLQNMIGLTPVDRIGGDGTSLNPYKWQVEFSNELGAGEGTYWGLIAVRDDLEGSENAPLGVSSDVIHPVKMHDLTVYQPFSVTIVAGSNIPPVADVEAAPSPVYENEDVTVSVGINCMDPDGTIVKYEYDFDYTPGDFVADAGFTQINTDINFGDDVVYSYSGTQLGSHLIAQRVTDNLGATNIDYTEVIVISLTNELPVADIVAGPSPVFVNSDVAISVGPLCTDPDGSIVKYEYDFDYNVGDFIADAPYTQDEIGPDFGDPFTYQYASEGTYVIAQRVTDNDSATDIDTETIQVIIVVNQPPVADVTATPDPVRVCANLTVSVGPLCQDPDGSIIKYEYDFDWHGDPLDFTPDPNPLYTQNAGDPDFGFPVVYQYPQGSNGGFLVAQRVTDNQLATDIAQDAVWVNFNVAPTANLNDNSPDFILNDGETVSFSPGVGTADPDGVITLYEYDWNYTIGNFTMDASNTNGAAIPHTFTNPGPGTATVLVAIRVTDDGCPFMTAIDYDTYTVNPPVTTGLPIIENFELTAGTAVPLNWAVIGKWGQSYYVATFGAGCTDNTWRWGVTVNSGQCNDPSGSPGQTHFLNENGFANGATDPAYTYENRATIACTPTFLVPAAGATLTVRHWYDFTWINWPLPPPPLYYFDGGRPIISENLSGHPTTVSYSDFCWNTEGMIGSSRPLNPPLTVTQGPAYGEIEYVVSSLHPFYLESCHTGFSGWVTSKYTIPPSYANQLVRIGFLFGSEDFYTINNECDYNLEPWDLMDDIDEGYGWRIQWMSIVAIP